MVKSKHIYSPQKYIESITGNYYCFYGDSDIDKIERILQEFDYDLWHYAIDAIEHVVASQIDVVLVDCVCYNSKTNIYEHHYRWFEVPADFKEEWP